VGKEERRFCLGGVGGISWPADRVQDTPQSCGNPVDGSQPKPKHPSYVTNGQPTSCGSYDFHGVDFI
jgi:hypothetical protein